ncbi:hypothetical protein JSE7799_00451 [Jannaschia seosinensis]|uniref:Calpastatin n=1 Tax=Jannaschia seosinensis TaxID=313367 RepID=A0A0M7B921_9RHOB|nr:DUF1810 family protein [Jannaschia seosinensis]CUH18776.1 hypothetical protein JSE7799_00451 [Jannaschia seosinensis]
MIVLSRFHDAQARNYDTALTELRQGRKRTHWIWYVFPQLRGLGRSETAQYYGIRDLAEARAYLADPVLGARLAEAAEALLRHDPPIERIVGEVDAMKVRSSATLFRAAGADGWAQAVLDRFYEGAADETTLDMIDG